MAALQEQDVLGQAIVNFSRDGVFPEEDEVSAMQIEDSALPGALRILAAVKLDLEVSLEIRIIYL
jgi:protein transport protein DSL1/ZW10